MTENTNRFLEPLTVDNAAVLLVDHQVGLFTGVRDIDVATLKHNVAALAKAAQVLGVPTVVTTTGADGMWGPLCARACRSSSGRPGGHRPQYRQRMGRPTRPRCR